MSFASASQPAPGKRPETAWCTDPPVVEGTVLT